jgi:Zn finger protein HypA/HybF involved in hydrogenase expression
MRNEWNITFTKRNLICQECEGVAHFYWSDKACSEKELRFIEQINEKTLRYGICPECYQKLKKMAEGVE